MKKIFLLVAVVAMSLPSCQKINEAIDGLDNRLDKLEQEAIPSIDEQIAAINVSLDNLNAMDIELKGYIDGLTATATNLQEQINAANIKIEEVKAELKNDITSTEDDLKEEIETAKANVIAQLEAAKEAMENELATINATIATLQAKDAELDGKITELRTYVDTELGDTTDWVNATFATLEQYNALVSEVATIKEQIKAINQSITELETRLTTKINEDIANAVSTLNADIQQKVSEITTAYTSSISTAKEEITAAYTTAIQKAINALDVSLKAWVGEQLANYYTIAEVEAKITALQTVITDGDATLQEELSKLKSQLETTATEITAAYKKAIEEAINTNNGLIDTKIANEIASVNQRITNEIATINAKIAEIESRLDNIEAKIAELLARIQSVSYIPTYSDGKATVKYSGDTSRVTLDFEVSPKDAVVELAKVWENAVSLKAVYTGTRAVSFIDMPIVKFESDPANGVISVTASGENLSTEFFNGTQSASVRLTISDGNNSVTSEYIHVFLHREVHEIRYTSTDGEIVTPFNIGAFDANIVSNIYIDGSGSIIFDGEIHSIGGSAFQGCSRLESIVIPDSVTSIGPSAFENCDSLIDVELPESVDSIGISAFAGNDKMKAFYGKFASSDKRCLIVDGVLNSFAPAELTEYTIPFGVKVIGYSAFQNCKNLAKVTISDSVKTIGICAFFYCSSLSQITIPSNVDSIEKYAFEGCSGLKYVAILNGVSTIGAGAFQSCKNITSICIPSSVKKLGEGVFKYCEQLSDVYCEAATPPTGDYSMFDNNAYGRKIYVPSKSVSTYKSASYWNFYASAIVGYDF